MTWLFSMYWLGALAVAGPIVFHMWRRTPRGTRSFSTLMFLTPSPPRITRRSKVEHWILLLLRAASLALLAFAFTRPLWRTPLTDPNTGPNEQLLAILVDTSASMRRTGVFDDLIRQLDDRLASLPPETVVALYRFDRQLVPVADFNELKSLRFEAQKELIRERLKNLRPTWQETRLGEALVQTAAKLQDAQNERPRAVAQRIWLASDLQSGAEIVALQGYEWPDELPVEIIPLRNPPTSNAGLQFVERNAESGDNVLRLRVTNAADSIKEQFTVNWDCAESPVVSVYVPPNQSRIVLPPKLPPGVTSTSLLLKGDDEDFDNRAHIAEPTPETRLVVYCGPESSNDSEGERYYLERVFAAAQRFKVELMDAHDFFASSHPAQPTLIILVQPELAQQPMIHSHLSNGGTVVLAPTTADAAMAGLKLCGREGITVSEATVPKYAMLGKIDFDDPLFAPFAESQFSDFTGIRFWKHRTISGFAANKRQKADEAMVSDDAKSDRVLAWFDDGDPAIVEFASQQGRIVLLTAGWHPADGQFARSSKFPMLMFRLLEQSTRATPRPGLQVVGSSLAWPASQAPAPVTGAATLPDGTQLSMQPVEHPFTRTEQPGIYTLSVPDRTEQVAVNLAPNESRTTPLKPEQLEGYGLKLKMRERSDEQERRKDRERQLQLAEIEQTQKLWQKILIAVIAILLLETFLSTFFTSTIKPDPIVQKES